MVGQPPFSFSILTSSLSNCGGAATFAFSQLHPSDLKPDFMQGGEGRVDVAEGDVNAALPGIRQWMTLGER